MNENPKPFIPRWLNMAGLSQADFRVYCYLASRADNGTGIAWPQAPTIAFDCIMAKNTVWKALRSLESMKLIRRTGKPFQGSNRYAVLTLPIGANEIPIEEPPIGANQIPSIGANEILQSAQMDSREGYPKKVIQRRLSKSEVSSDGIQFAQWFKSTLPKTVNLKANWQESFAKEYDDLMQIDKRSPEQIMAVCRWARTDSFWQKIFMSPAKLRKRNGEGIQYFDVIAEKMKAPSAWPSKATVPTIDHSKDPRSKLQLRTHIEE